MCVRVCIRVCLFVCVSRLHYDVCKRRSLPMLVHPSIWIVFIVVVVVVTPISQSSLLGMTSCSEYWLVTTATATLSGPFYCHNYNYNNNYTAHTGWYHFYFFSSSPAAGRYQLSDRTYHYSQTCCFCCCCCFCFLLQLRCAAQLCLLAFKTAPATRNAK